MSNRSAAPRGLGLISLACLVVANMIGAGVYTSSGFALADLHDRGTVMTAWAAAGLVACLGAVCYGGLARQMTESGGEYLFLSRAIHPLAGFMAGWISLSAGFSGAIAYSALTFQRYLPESAWISSLPSVAVPLALIAVFGAVHWIGLETGSRFQNALVLSKLALLVAFVGYGVWRIGFSADLPASGADASAPEAAIPPVSSLAFATSVMWISFSYAGYNAAVYVAGASRSGAVVARSMWLATLVVTGLYLALNAVVLYAVPVAELAGQEDVMRIAAASLGGQFFGGQVLERIVSGVILLSLATSVSAMLHAGPHVYAQMARDGVLPRFLASGPQDVPRPAIVLQVLLAGMLVIYANLQQLLDYLAFLLMISSAATVACLLVPRLAGAPGRRPVPLWPITPLVFVAISLGVAGLALQYRLSKDPRGLGLALSVIPVGLMLYPLCRRWGSAGSRT